MTTTATPPSQITDDEQRQLTMFFEQGRSLPQLLATLRSRRVAMGYQIESALGHRQHRWLPRTGRDRRAHGRRPGQLVRP